MAIDSTAKKANVRLSLKKYFIDTFQTQHSKKLLFDDLFSLPQIPSLSEWLIVQFGAMHRGGLSDFIVEVLCATRRDPDGDKLSDLSDLAFNLLSDNSQIDGKRRITLYETSVVPWTEIGALLVQDVIDSKEMNGEDGTKYQVLTCKIRWVSKA